MAGATLKCIVFPVYGIISLPFAISICASCFNLSISFTRNFVVFPLDDGAKVLSELCLKWVGPIALAKREKKKNKMLAYIERLINGKHGPVNYLKNP